jgi:hypothetical protein
VVIILEQNGFFIFSSFLFRKHEKGAQRVEDDDDD